MAECIGECLCDTKATKLDETFVKHDGDKNRLELIDPEFILGIGKVLTIGAKKYSDDNWKKADTIDRYKGAILRHTMAYMNGEEIDPETGLSHMYSVGCNAMFLAYFERHGEVHPNQGRLDLCHE